MTVSRVRGAHTLPVHLVHAGQCAALLPLAVCCDAAELLEELAAQLQQMTVLQKLRLNRPCKRL